MARLASSIQRVSSPDGGIVLDLCRGTMFRLNPLGSKILDLLDSGNSPAQIAQQLSAEFGVSFELVQVDVQEFLDSLKLHYLIDSRDSAA